MKIERPLYPRKITPPKFGYHSLKPHVVNNPALDAALDKVSPYGPKKAFMRTKQDMDSRLEMMNRRLAQSVKNNRLEFEKHEITGRMIIRLVDRDTGNVIREYPDEQSLANIETLQSAGSVKSVIG
ncbi:MAG: flagellar protein FlaG [SAR324 cluster bacterium]|nr:flagellar protein FlaG [SAR324 cluster bacterium]